MELESLQNFQSGFPNLGRRARRCIIERMSLAINTALRLDAASCIAFTGAGGKTTALFQLARSLQPPVIVTATTHLGVWQVGLADRHIIADSPESLIGLKQGLKGILLVTGNMDGERTKPVNDQVIHWLHEFCRNQAIPLLIEADGARQKPLKAWAEHEPAIPAFADLIVQVIGLSALGKTLGDENVHRAHLFSEVSGLNIGEPVTVDAVLQVLTHPDGGLKNIPAGARRVTLLNQSDTPELQSAANGMVRPLLAVYDSVIISSLVNREIYAVHEPVAGVILAAGESSRYGSVKQLLDWRGEPFVRAVARTALEAGCLPVVVVTGAHEDRVEAAVQGLKVRIVHNANWQEGQSSSIRAGLVGLEGAGAAIFLLADQPQVTASVLRALMEKHAEGLYPILAPMVMDRRANPVLFDRSTFHDLAAIQGDVGGRAIFHRHRVEYLPWQDDRLLLDVDTPEMYQRLISDDTL